MFYGRINVFIFYCKQSQIFSSKLILNFPKIFFSSGIAIVTSILTFIATVYELTSIKSSPNSNEIVHVQNPPLPPSINGTLRNGKINGMNGKHLELHQIQTNENNNSLSDVELESATKTKNKINEEKNQEVEKIGNVQRA